MDKREKPVVDEFNTRIVSGYKDPGLYTLKMAPIVSATQAIGKFMLMGAEMWRYFQNLKRALTAPRVRIDMRWHKQGYATDEFGVEMPIYDKVINAVPERNRDRFRTKMIKRAVGAIQLGMVYTIVDFLRDLNNYDGALVDVFNVGTRRWTDKVNSTPYEDLTRGLNLLHGRVPGSVKDLSIGISKACFDALMAHPETFVRSKAWGLAPGEELVAKVVGCKEAVILEDQKMLDFDDEVHDSATFVDLWDDEVVFFYEVTEPDPDFTDALSLAIVRIDGNPVVQEPYREPRVKADIHAVDDEWGLANISNKRRVIFDDVV
jgi:hypothetical protein